MTRPLIATKLYAPRRRQGVVARPRLDGRLGSADCKLILVSAPAGFGKTTLLAGHFGAAASGRSVAWLSLEPADNEPVRFWSHVVAALRTTAPEIGAMTLAMLQEGGHKAELFLAPLVNELAALPSGLDLVLDDFHVIDHGEIEDGVGFLLEHLPAFMRIVISTRADPPLPLARLRARGELLELRAADLRFTAEEASSYLNDAMGLGLPPADVAVLEKKSEGWIAALQLAALSVQNRADGGAFIAGFAGNDRYIVDYLVDEVLRRQPEHVRSFLRQTAFLDRLSGPLCDAVTGGRGSAGTLQALERANLFIVPLDDRRQWYRYHHLFADVLLTHFADELEPFLPMLHERAGRWYAEHGEPGEAIRHALSGGAFTLAAELIERAIPQLRRERRESVLREWIEALPDAVTRARPVLADGYAGVLLASGQFERVEALLADAEQGLARHAQGDRSLVADEAHVRGLPSSIETYRAALAQIRGDAPGTIAHATKALALAPAGDHLERAAPAGFLGIAYWTEGELAAARAAWRQCRAGLEQAGHIADVYGTSIALADIARALGQLREAAGAYESALRLAAERSPLPLRGTADAHAGLAGLHLVRNDLSAAALSLRTADALGDVAGLPQFLYRRCVAEAELCRAQGRLDEALSQLEVAESVYVGDFFPNVRPLAAMKARVWIAQGRLDDAERWASEANVTAGDAPVYLHEYEHLTLARLLIARQDHAAAALLGRLGESAERGGRVESMIEVAILTALVHRAEGDGDAALAALRRALELAGPEGFVRIFLDKGEAVVALLRLASKRGAGAGFARRVLASWDPAGDVPQDHPDLVEPLSGRELDVLRLLRTELDGPDIARELAVSLNTMRTHTKNIYEKLGVSSRRAAVRRAEELNLLPRR